MGKIISFKAFFITLAVVFAAGLVFSLVVDHLTSAKSSPSVNTISNIPTLPIPVSFDLEVNQPEDKTLVFNDSIPISGTTSPRSFIIISNGGDDLEVDADLHGNFSKAVDLNRGLNFIYITAFDSQGNTKQIKRTVYYSEEQL